MVSATASTTTGALTQHGPRDHLPVAGAVTVDGTPRMGQQPHPRLVTASAGPHADAPVLHGTARASSGTGSSPRHFRQEHDCCHWPRPLTQSAWWPNTAGSRHSQRSLMAETPPCGLTISLRRGGRRAGSQPPRHTQRQAPARIRRHLDQATVAGMTADGQEHGAGVAVGVERGEAVEVVPAARAGDRHRTPSIAPHEHSQRPQCPSGRLQRCH
jgi:hypothetical protein